MLPKVVALLARAAGFLRTRRGATLVISLAAALALFWVFSRDWDEPSYQGISASEWLESANTNRLQIVKVTMAFRAMGPDGAKFLGKELSVKPSRLHDWLLAHHQRIPSGVKSLVLKPQGQFKQEIILDILNGLGSDATPAMPLILDWLDQKGPYPTLTYPLPTNGFTILSNTTGLAFAPPQRFSGSLSTNQHMLLIPGQSPYTMITQAVISAPGVITTNVIVTVKVASNNIPKVAFQILTNLGSEDPRIIKALLNPIERVVLASIPTLGTNLKTAASQSVPMLLLEVESQQQHRKLMAYSMLSLTLPETTATREFMVRKLSDPDVKVFDMAANSLMTTTNEVERIIPLVADGLAFFRNRPPTLWNSDWRSPAYNALAHQGRQHSALVVTNLQRVFKEAGFREQIHIFELLGSMARPEQLDMAYLSSFTNSHEASLRSQACLTLGQINDNPQLLARGHIIRIETCPGQFDVLWKSYGELGKLGTNAKAAVPVLIDALSNANERLVARAIEALAAIGPEAKAALPNLESLWQHPQLIVREKAEEAIRKISVPSKDAK